MFRGTSTKCYCTDKSQDLEEKEQPLACVPVWSEGMSDKTDAAGLIQQLLYS